MDAKTYSEIVAKKLKLNVPELDGPFESDPRYWNYNGCLIEEAEVDALIFKHWTEMLPEKHGVVKHGLVKWGDSWAIGMDTKADGFQFLCVENTPLDALTEFWRTYEGG